MVETLRFVDLGRQYQAIKPAIDRAIATTLERGDFVLGDDVRHFENEFAEYCEAAYAIGLDNGASALELALQALEIGRGAEVIVPVNTFFASAASIARVGATPVFVDADPVTYNIDVNQIEAHITPRTRAIMPVHLYGQPADMNSILDLAERYDLYVIEDACQAHGARYDGQRVGALGHVGAFSFYPGKNLGAYGDGGALVTNDSRIAERVRILRNCGQREKYRHVALGGNHRLDTIQAAILRVKLTHLDSWNAQRRHWAALYTELLADAGVVVPSAPAHIEPVHHLYVIQAEERDQLQQHLGDAGIATGIHYPIPLHLQPAFASLGGRPGDFPVAESQSNRLLSLPIFAELLSQEVEFVTSTIAAFTQASQPRRLSELAVGN